METYTHLHGLIMEMDGNFLAETVVFKPTGDLEMVGAVTSADAAANTVNMFGLTVHLVNNTFVEDDRDVSDDERVKYLFGADDLSAGDWLKIKAYKNSNGELVATKMVRKTKESDDVSELEGKVDSIDPSTMVSGVKVDMAGALTVAVGDLVELEGSYDATTNTFTVTSAEPGEADDHYIGGEDGEEHKEDEHNDESHGDDDSSHNDDDSTSDDSDSLSS